ncbi:peptidoglycan bridge formation glycyltransferase FemA/FemB family protein [Curvivirga aplysinae]|uniref:peptidoglycan bridge formation glycyltransferase FemA/FemB family protein n=1 Tax=Curvivirga aplysinae TaxID=2529852 RepID=UPI0012BCD0A5|nr:peptidoglycan bridge formation glycyltransferase FemA/FemB family protein [Curvivirga aplysinae]MTI09009.1 peptidoglycan bridge formation glycyltransferase FemA/FemB family protein [Curvivirga aplysinae]
MNKIHLEWEEFSQQDWEDCLNKIPRSNAFHDWDMAEILTNEFNNGLERCLIKRGNKIIGLAQLYNVPKLKILTHRKLIRGPIFSKPPMPDELMDILLKIKQRKSLLKGYMTDLMPELPDSEAVNRELSKNGLHKVLRGYQSIWIDLRKSEDDLRKDLHSKWRNQLSKAEHENLDFMEDANAEDWLLQHVTDQQNTIGYDAMPPAVYFKLPDSKKMVVSIQHNQEPCAAVLIQLHGQSATYQLSFADETGKKLNAMNLLLWKSILHLKNRRINNFDLGGIEPEKNPGLARFKERMGGESFTLAGNFT